MWYSYRPYVSGAQRRAKARRAMAKLRKQGVAIQPIELPGRTIARTFWGKAWGTHLESFSDYANRLPRGRRYVRNGSVCHLDIQPGAVEAMVSGSELYNLRVRIESLPKRKWAAIRSHCTGKIGSLLELLQGKLSDEIMAVVTDRQNGLFPLPGEIHFACDCPDWAIMCKHVAAVMYGVGHRLDSQPEKLFVLRQVDHGELISGEHAVDSVVGAGSSGRRVLEADRLGDIFGIELDDGPAAHEPAPKAAAKPKKRRRPRARRPAEPTGRPSGKAADPDGSAAGEPRPRKPASSSTPSIRPTGKSVARLRKRLGLSVAELADALGVSVSSVYRWESTAGRLRLRTGTLRALADLRSQRRGG